LKSLIFYCIRSKTVCGAFHGPLPAKRENSRKKFLNQSIFANFRQLLPASEALFTFYFIVVLLVVRIDVGQIMAF
jgi:hypothetical protein